MVRDISDCRKRRWGLRLEFKTKAAAGMFLLAVFFGLLQCYVFTGEADGTWAGYASGLVTELCGVAMTILLIDMVLEQQERRRDIRRLADEMLYQVDYIVWVWLGGDRVFSYEEMQCLLGSVTQEDELHPVTETLLQNLGNEAAKRMRLHSELVRADQALCHGLCSLAGLASIRARQEPMSPAQVPQVLRAAVAGLDGVLCCSASSGQDGRRCVTSKRSGKRFQHYRHLGELDMACPEGREEILEYEGG